MDKKYEVYGTSRGQTKLIGQYSDIESAAAVEQRFPYFDSYIIKEKLSDTNKAEKGGTEWNFMNA